jgi:hypothetical protein
LQPLTAPARKGGSYELRRGQNLSGTTGRRNTARRFPSSNKRSLKVFNKKACNCDKFGRSYARLKTLKFGDTVQVDEGFTCLPAGAMRVVLEDKFGLFILCSGEAEASSAAFEKHYLDGQASFEMSGWKVVRMFQNPPLIGIYPVLS